MDEPKVLIVEDSVEMADLLAISLQDDDIETEIAGTGEAALEVLRNGDFQLVLLDLGLPDIDGMEVLEKIRGDEQLSRLPVIVITGREKMRDKVRAFDLGAVDYINKPINFLDVQARIVATLRRKEKQAEEDSEVNQAFQRTQEDLVRISKAVDSASDAVSIVDAGQRISYVNDAFTSLFGVTGEDLQVMARFRRLFAEGRIWEEIWEVCEEHGSFAGELEMRNDEGDELIVHCRADAILDDRRNFLGTVILYTDIRQHKRLEDDLVFLANHDALTGLNNRQHFAERMRRVVAELGDDAKSFLLYLDLDHFKVVNHRINHHAGDRFLIEIARLLEENLRDGDELARVGGDEFAMLLTALNETEAITHARTLGSRLSASQFEEGDDRFSCSASIGMAVIEGDVGTEDVLSQAVAAAYQVKENGGNGVELFRSDQQSLQQLGEDASWFMRVKRALEENRLEVWLQPIVAVGGGELPTFEALVRYRATDGTIVSPDSFLPAAERFGILHQIDHFVFYQVVGAMRDNPKLNASVNLSARALTSERLPELVKSLMTASNVAADRIHFEITETTMIRNLERAKVNICELQEFGCRFALDDFGKGVSSLGCLRDLPVDIIKIDGSFVENIENDEVNLSIVRAVNDISHQLGKKTVAEYVSNPAILAKVKEIGIDYVQGWHVCKPAPIAEFLKVGLESVKLPVD
jgi:diguanylate cyclase (GGDEF)-like protein/PAS domain S-box-containing protein